MSLFLRLFLVCCLCIACGAKRLPPPAKPEARVPMMGLEPPPSVPGMGRVAFDVVEGESAISIITSQSSALAVGTGGSAAAFGSTTQFVCNTPCVVNMPYGVYKISVTNKANTERRSEEIITVGEAPLIVRMSLGLIDFPNAGKKFAGICAAVFGPSTALFGAPIAAAQGSSSGVLATSTVGLSLTVIGGVLLHRNRLILQDGSTNQWNPQDQVIYQRQ